MKKEILLTEAYEDTVKAFEKVMIENNMPLYWLDVYLPELMAKKAIAKGIEIFKQIKEEREDK